MAAGLPRASFDVVFLDPPFGELALGDLCTLLEHGWLAAGARVYLERFAAVAPASAESLYLSVRVELQIGNRNKAAAYERMLRERFPDSAEIQRLRTQ